MPDHDEPLKDPASHSLRSAPVPGGHGVVCILGMHRSGTSCLAGSLEEAGLALGDDVIKEAPYNLKGNRENPRIMALHQDLLTSNGGSWHTPPPSVRWSREHRDRQAVIIASYRRFPVWGFKDPRTLLTLEGWREALPQMRFVGTFRHPVAVARSLHARDDFSLERGMELWAHYNRILLRYQAELDFDVISFDLSPAAYLARMSAIARRLHLSPPRQGFRFFESQLRHNSADLADPLPAEVAAIHSELSHLTAGSTHGSVPATAAPASRPPV